MRSAQHSRERSPGLDLARTLGITGVVLAHSTMFLELLGFPLEDLMPLHAWGGFLGVELFFALSGLLIGEILFRDVIGCTMPSRLGIFLVRRWLRTLPAYYVVLVCLVLIALWRGDPLPSLWKYIFFLQNAAPAYASFFGVSWSLSIEQWSYIIIPVLLCFSYWYRGKDIPPETLLLWLLLIIMAVCAIIRGVVAYSGPAYWDNDFRKQVWMRLDTVVYGVMLAWVRHFKSNVYQRLGTLPCFVFSLMLLGLIARNVTVPLLQPEGNLFMKSIAFSLVDGLCAVILAFLDTNASVRHMLQPQRLLGRVCFWGSRYSYSLYLVHLTIFSSIVSLFNITKDSSALEISCCFTLALSVSVACAALLYHGVEKPGMDLRRAFFFKSPA